MLHLIADEDDFLKNATLVTAGVHVETAERKALTKEFGRMWTAEELERDFIIKYHTSPCMNVKEKSTGKTGQMWLHINSGLYYGFKPSKVYKES